MCVRVCVCARALSLFLDAGVNLCMRSASEPKVQRECIILYYIYIYIYILYDSIYIYMTVFILYLICITSASERKVQRECGGDEPYDLGLQPSPATPGT